MKFVRKSLLTGTVRERNLDVTEAQLQAWKGGALIQDALPHLSADDREWLQTGITAEEWEKAFGSEGDLFQNENVDKVAAPR